MSRNNTRSPAVPPPARNGQLLPSKSELKEFDASPLRRIVLIIGDGFLGSAVFARRFWVKHLQRIAAADRARYHTRHIRLRNRRSRTFVWLRSAAGHWNSISFRDGGGRGGSDEHSNNQRGFHRISCKRRRKFLPAPMGKTTIIGRWIILKRLDAFSI